MTLGTYAQAWLARTGRLRPTSARAYASALRQHVLPALGAHELGALDPLTIRAFLSRYIDAGIAPNSVRSYLTALSTVLTDAVLDGLVAHNAAHGAARRLLPAARVDPRALS